MNYEKGKKYLLPAGACVLVLLGLLYYYFFSSILADPQTKYIYVDNDDTADSVVYKVALEAKKGPMCGFRILTRLTDYGDHIHAGRYEMSPSIGSLQLFRHIKNGMQKPVQLTVPSVRTMDRMAEELAKHLMVDADTLDEMLHDQTVCEKLGYDTATVAAMFIPNTYDIYWTISPEKLLQRMKKEHDNFWNPERQAKANKLHLNANEVATLASIVDEETANNQEKPMIAGMYYNRLMLRSAKYPQGMPLQADPTIKFAWKKFELHRIYHNLLTIRSPYNTYVNPGLPPGPIRVPSIEGIDAVLDMVHHNYLYMCAKEDFSGTHNFAVTYSEHLKNAARYSKALNERGIK